MQSGTSLYLVVIIMTVLLAMVLGLSTIFIDQVALLREMGYSVIAFYAADAGIERVLDDREDPELASDYYSCYSLSSPPCSLDNEATYKVFVTSGETDDCASPNYCIKSVGTYKGVSRAIEITY